MKLVTVGVLLYCVHVVLLSCHDGSMHSTKEYNNNSIIVHQLGKALFFETRLSVTATKSCASCHAPQHAFSDGYRRSPGVYADLHRRNTPSLINIASQKYFNWANPSLTSLEAQMNEPLFGTQPIEMGLDSTVSDVLEQIQADSLYNSYLVKLGQPLSWSLVKYSIASYVKTLLSYNSPYDRYLRGEKQAINPQAIAGEQLFFSEKLACSSCHQPPNFSTTFTTSSSDYYQRTRLYKKKEIQQLPSDKGLAELTGNAADEYKFKIPTLRNLKWTAPYFHEGAAETLDDVLVTYDHQNAKHYASDKKRSFIQLTKEERNHLLDFLETLNDSTIFSNPNFQSPHAL